MQNSNLISILLDAGLEEKEAALYLAGVELGEASIQSLSEQAGIKRPTAYQIMGNLEKKGLFSEVHSGKKKLFLAENPNSFLEILKIKQQAFIKVLPELNLFYAAGGKKPRVKFYEGVEGLKAIYLDTLQSKHTLLEYGSIDDMWNVMPKSFIVEYVKARIKQGLWVKGLVPNTQAGQDYMKNDTQELRELILIPKNKFMFSNEITIYNNKLAIVSFPEKIGVVIESKKIAETQKMIFQLAWLGALQAT
jgi:sugar-specific transcriptional regulator TrmB